MAKFDLNTWGQSYLQSDNSIYIYISVHAGGAFTPVLWRKEILQIWIAFRPSKKNITMQFLSLESWCRNTSPKSKAFRFENNPMSKHNHCHSFIRHWVIPTKKNGVEIFNIPTYPLVVISDDISPVCPHYGWLNPPFVMLDQAIFRCRLYPLLYYYIPIDWSLNPLFIDMLTKSICISPSLGLVCFFMIFPLKSPERYFLFLVKAPPFPHFCQGSSPTRSYWASPSSVAAAAHALPAPPAPRFHLRARPKGSRAR